jgi:hypothetical protein
VLVEAGALAKPQAAIAATATVSAMTLIQRLMIGVCPLRRVAA